VEPGTERVPAWIKMPKISNSGALLALFFTLLQLHTLVLAADNHTLHFIRVGTDDALKITEEYHPSRGVKWLHERDRWSFWGLKPRPEAGTFPSDLSRNVEQRDRWRTCFVSSPLCLNPPNYASYHSCMHAVIGCGNWGLVFLGKSREI
jgi:hypothetical protein